MFTLRLATVAAMLALGSVADPRVYLERRDAVADCRLVLVALKASAFCSSFVPIVDVTSTSTGAGTLITTTVAGNPCTTTAATSTTVSTVVGTDTVFTTQTVTTVVTTYLAKAKRAAATSAAAVAVASPAPKCMIKGLNVNLSLFACDIIKQACRLYVKAKTVTVRLRIVDVYIAVLISKKRSC